MTSNFEMSPWDVKNCEGTFFKGNRLIDNGKHSVVAAVTVSVFML